MSIFAHQIEAAHPNSTDIRNRRWVYVPYDRYTDRTGPLAEQPAKDTGVVIVESTAKAHRRPYHKKKLVLLISNMRHFALEQAARGCSVVYRFSPHSHGQALTELQKKLHLPELTVMQAAERELRLDLSHAVENGLHLREVPDTTWFSTTADFTNVFGSYRPGKSYVMDRFYRHMRQQTGILMRNAKPLGGRFSYDADNRKPYKNQVPIPIPPAFPPDSITREVAEMVEQTYPHHFGLGDGFDLPTTQTECDEMWSFALQHLLPAFGPFEDAMRDDQLQLFHSRTSALVNLGRLLPANLIRDVEQAVEAGRIPLASGEGFIRQLLGWREFMRHIHQQTDGYRLLNVAQEQPTKPASRRIVQDDPYPAQAAAPSLDPYAGARPSALHASLPLPAVYWGVKSGLHCMDTVVDQVIREGWSHHITRLMVLSNLATLCGFSPRQLTDWFWFAYVDAYDWVVEPNVLGMATYADGGVTATKPYVSGAAYINRMSNFCGHCRYDPKKSTGEDSCPFTSLYWTFLERNQSILEGNFRLQMPYTALRKKSAQELVQLRTRAEEAITHLQSFPVPDY
ncbi:MAG: cryptochrome/photolyase family protein [Acidobacteriota bacterium]|nr:cryptochrome/photolyase family protein [Acidobacteriota bacterium]